jgi:hypothetical protein
MLDKISHNGNHDPANKNASLFKKKFSEQFT